MVHTEISWFDENGKLTIRPDITIIEPEHLTMQQLNTLSSCEGYPRFRGRWNQANDPVFPRSSFPSKEFQFEGKAITFELKLARDRDIEIGERPFRFDKLSMGYGQIRRLFNVLDNRGQGDDIFSYLVFFSKTPINTPGFYNYLNQHGESYRHKIICKSRVA